MRPVSPRPSSGSLGRTNSPVPPLSSPLLPPPVPPRRRRWLTPTTTGVLLGLLLLVCKEAFFSSVVLPMPGAPVEVRRHAGPSRRWTPGEARRWAGRAGWLVGANFVPSTAVNQLEMFQDATWDPATVDRELRWAADVGMNCMRVFLHDLLYRNKPDAFLARLDEYLAIADRHRIKTIFVLFDACWRGDARLGPQPPPLEHVHNSGWLQSPSYAQLKDTTTWWRLRDYVQGVVGRFGSDPRVVMWDIYNEPNNVQLDFGLVATRFADRDVPFTREEKNDLVLGLMDKAFDWARSVRPTQPLTAAPWGSMSPDDTGAGSPDAAFTRMMLSRSDVLSFHNYDPPSDKFRDLLNAYLRMRRPVVCTEYMQRTGNSTFLSNLPLLAEHRIGAINWGLVDGKTQTIVCFSPKQAKSARFSCHPANPHAPTPTHTHTHTHAQYPWDSWVSKLNHPPVKWHHDVFRRSGQPYDGAEVELIERWSDSIRHGQEGPGG